MIHGKGVQSPGPNWRGEGLGMERGQEGILSRSWLVGVGGGTLSGSWPPVAMSWS